MAKRYRDIAVIVRLMMYFDLCTIKGSESWQFRTAHETSISSQHTSFSGSYNFSVEFNNKKDSFIHIQNNNMNNSE